MKRIHFEYIQVSLSRKESGWVNTWWYMSSWMKSNQVVDSPLPSSLLDPPAQRERQACKVSFVFSAENHFFLWNYHQLEFVRVGLYRRLIGHCPLFPGWHLVNRKRWNSKMSRMHSILHINEHCMRTNLQFNRRCKNHFPDNPGDPTFSQELIVPLAWSVGEASLHILSKTTITFLCEIYLKVKAIFLLWTPWLPWHSVKL